MTILSAYVTNLGKYNEGALVGEWVQFPTTKEKINEVFKNIGIGGIYEEWFITDYESDIDYLTDSLGEFENLNELNYLAEMIDNLYEMDVETLQGTLCLESVSSVADIINVIENLDDCFVRYPGVEDDRNLGWYIVNESGYYDTKDLGPLADYIDYEALGRDADINAGGTYTDYGYVEQIGSISTVYEGLDDIPDEFRII